RETVRDTARRGSRERVMMAARARVAAIVLGVTLSPAPDALALSPSLDVRQYVHTAWKLREGFAKGAISAIAQTAAGYIWLGTPFGLFRFDGVRNVAWQPPRNQRLPSDDITKLAAGRDGTLWIGTRNGLASWNGRSVTRYADIGGLVLNLLEDRNGHVWATEFTNSRSRLCAV